MDTNTVVSEIKNSLRSCRTADIDKISNRACTSDEYEGVSVTITGRTVPIRPVLEAVGRLDDWHVENVGMYSDADQQETEDGEIQFQYGVILFCAYTGEEIKTDIFT